MALAVMTVERSGRTRDRSVGVGHVAVENIDLSNGIRVTIYPTDNCTLHHF